ncbi:hypothetical protein [Telmatospirillum sp.]|uniref:hypothetical protein n=1 Tax=Telmatospirillum sp. TaxID=2079197 RepID=UPI002851483B|nr:hypothetical protein [Telmatospirillum sp.]MDR3436478.1 hypothetical protein [Telmatospirillum sp.]
MGDAADDAFDQAMNELFDREFDCFDPYDEDPDDRRRPDPEIWVTADGDRIRISDLTDDHLYRVVMHLASKGKDNPRIAEEWADRGFPRPNGLEPLRRK